MNFRSAWLTAGLVVVGCGGAFTLEDRRDGGATGDLDASPIDGAGGGAGPSGGSGGSSGGPTGGRGGASGGVTPDGAGGASTGGSGGAAMAGAGGLSGVGGAGGMAVGGAAGVAVGGAAGVAVGGAAGVAVGGAAGLGTGGLAGAGGSGAAGSAGHLDAGKEASAVADAATNDAAEAAVDPAACTGPGQCVAVYKGCCPSCSMPDIRSYEAVNSAYAAEYRPPGCSASQLCLKCQDGQVNNPNVGATCVANRCTLFDVRTVPEFSGCSADADCQVRQSVTCCGCGAFVGVSIKGNVGLSDAVCPSRVTLCRACPAPPIGTTAVCGKSAACVIPATTVTPAPVPTAL